MISVREIIVVEGRDDERAVKQAVDAEVIITHGFGLTGEAFDRIAVARRHTGVIIFTDPDHAGELIRRRINARIHGCKNAYLTSDRASHCGDIGIEHARAEDIVTALMSARCVISGSGGAFTRQMLMLGGLVNCAGAARKRSALGRILGIGYANGRQLLNRLNRYGISERRFRVAMTALDSIPHKDDER